jgi:hypothetical protein
VDGLLSSPEAAFAADRDGSSGKGLSLAVDGLLSSPEAGFVADPDWCSGTGLSFFVGAGGFESEDCALGAGFFCGCGASGTGWLCCVWAEAPVEKIGTAANRATIRSALRIVAGLILDLPRSGCEPGEGEQQVAPLRFALRSG